MYRLCLNFEHVLKSSEENKISVKEVLKQLKINGIGAVDINYSHLVGKKSYARDIFASGVDIACIYYMGDYANSSNITETLTLIDYCVERKVKNIMLLTTPAKCKEDVLNKDNLSLLKQNLRRIVKYANSLNIEVGLENFGLSESYFSSLNLVHDILKSVKGLGIVFDVGNFYVAGEDPVLCVKTLLPYLQKLHLKDRTLLEVSLSNPTIDEKGNKLYASIIGKGDCKIKEVFDIITPSYKDLDCTLEFDFKDDNIMEKVIESASYYYTELL